MEGEEIIISNKELTTESIKNYKRMQERRVLFGFGLILQTESEKLKKVVEIVKQIISEQKLTKLDRVHFAKIGEYSLYFEAVYYLQSEDYNVFMDVQEGINFKIKERFDEEKIYLAYPTTTLHVDGQ